MRSRNGWKAVSAAMLLMAGLAGRAVAQNPVVVLDTSKGPITIELFADKAPISVENFLKYVDSGHYDNTLFHRVIGPNPKQPQGFMIQGGGFENLATPTEKDTQAPIQNEGKNGLKNDRGTLAMARTGEPNSATSQFFINLGNNDFLNYGDAHAVDPFGYAVFGKVLEGMEVVDAIAKVETGRSTLAQKAGGRLLRGASADVPKEPVVIKSAKRKSAG